MKRSRIICSIIAVITILISVFLLFVLVDSTMYTKSDLSLWLKAIYIALFVILVLLYSGTRKKLLKKVKSEKLINIYCYGYLAIIVFIVCFVMAYALKNSNVGIIQPGMHIGLGSYISYGLGFAIGKQMYANVIINTIITFLSAIIIKRIILNITESDTVSTITCIGYILIPPALMNVVNYTKYSYNMLVVLIGTILILKIIDIVKDFNLKNKSYLIYAVVLGVIQALDIAFGGSYVFWVLVMLIVTMSANYVDSTRIRFNDKLKNKFNYKIKILMDKIERVNISKLVYVSIISLAISGISCIVCLCLGLDSFVKPSIENLTSILMHSRSYYIVLIIFSLVFEIIGLILKRKTEIKMFVIKVAALALMMILPFMEETIYTTQVFDTLLVLTAVINICNICYNREEKVKLLKDKN